jgi:crossover junction endodeoxyribonuclease RuvC
MSLRVLGLDPGTATFGWGMVESGGERPRYLAHGVITTSPSQSLGERLLHIRTELTQIARESSICGRSCRRARTRVDDRG